MAWTAIHLPRDRVGGVLRLLDRRGRFWAVFLPLFSLPTIRLQANRISLTTTTSGADLGRFSLVNTGTHMVFTLALQLAVVVTFLPLVKRGGSVAGGEVECTR